jgi:hypothetical protein
MKRVMLGVCLVALLTATTAVSAASAAEPAFFECAKVMGGKFKGPCAVEGPKGNHELQEGIGNGKAVKWKGTTFSPFIPAVSGGKLECKKVTVTGSLANATTFKGIRVVETECFGGTSRFCTTAGQKPHTVVSNPLEGTLGYISGPEHKVGLDLKGEGGADLFDYNCEGLEEDVGGSVIGEITPVNTLTNKYAVVFVRDGEGFQSIKNFEGQPEDVPVIDLNGSAFKGSLEGSLTLTGEKLEIKG